MRIGSVPTIVQSRRFAPRPWAVLLWLAVAAAMLALGRWQLLRADEKIRLIEAAEAARAAEPVDVERLDGTGDDALDAREAAAAYRRVSARGTWLAERQFLWDNRAHAGRPGLEVVTPLLLEDGRAVLVNRGWTPLPASRAVPPDVGLSDAGPVELVGLASRPSRGFSGGEAFVADAPWPRWLQWFDYDGTAAALDRPIVPIVLQPERAARDGPGSGSDAHLLQENWQPAASGPEKHWSYAVQWFAMAAALTVAFVVVNLRRPDRDPDRDPEPTPPSPDDP